MSVNTPVAATNHGDVNFRTLPSDIALANLLCASGLPGVGTLPVNGYLDWLNEAARQVQIETDRNYIKFLDAPGAFQNSQARYCVVCLVTVLQRQLRVKYNPKWIGLTPDQPVPDAFGQDADNLFIHAIMDGVGGTCGSLPVLYIAIGRRLGYPLRLVKAARHLFVRWDDPDGKLWFHPDRFNIEPLDQGCILCPTTTTARGPIQFQTKILNQAFSSGRCRRKKSTPSS